MANKPAPLLPREVKALCASAALRSFMPTKPTSLLPRAPEILLARDQPPLDQDVADGAEHRQDLRLPRAGLLLELFEPRDQRGEVGMSDRAAFLAERIVRRALARRPGLFSVVVPANAALDRVGGGRQREHVSADRQGNRAQMFGVRRIVG